MPLFLQRNILIALPKPTSSLYGRIHRCILPCNSKSMCHESCDGVLMTLLKKQSQEAIARCCYIVTSAVWQSAGLHQYACPDPQVILVQARPMSPQSIASFESVAILSRWWSHWLGQIQFQPANVGAQRAARIQKCLTFSCLLQQQQGSKEGRKSVNDLVTTISGEE